MAFSFQIILGVALALALGLVLVRRMRSKQRLAAEAVETLFSEVKPLLENAERTPGESMGSWKLMGRYGGHVFQFKTIVDTLAVRKLPSLWLLVTLPEPTGLAATFDLMMRPAGPTTFSNFDFLPQTLATPPGFPPEAVLRSDAVGAGFPAESVCPLLPILQQRRGKEILLSPKGLRIVVQLAEADRARYGVFREARFAGAVIDASLAAEIMNGLIQMKEDISQGHG